MGCEAHVILIIPHCPDRGRACSHVEAVHAHQQSGTTYYTVPGGRAEGPRQRTTWPVIEEIKCFHVGFVHKDELQGTPNDTAAFSYQQPSPSLILIEKCKGLPLTG